nr:G2/mitotic-specific cyclin-B3-like [Salvelinus alpinus]
MPFPRGKKPSVTAGSKIPKLLGKGLENQEEGPQVKRSSSSPQGAPKKRTAFVDITNAHKVHISLPGTKKNSRKKTQKKKATASVSDQNDANLKKSESVSSESPEEEKQRGEEESPVEELVVVVEAVPPRELPPHLRRPQIPEEFDIDAQHQNDPTLTAQYAKEIFDYLKAREEKFILSDYMSIQPSLNAGMRAVLVDWLVEVQENFELNHETLYLAVKVTDHFCPLCRSSERDLQLIGSTAMLIASKFEVRDIEHTYTPCVVWSAYGHLRWRYVCELSLQEMDMVPERGSLLASACLLLALVTKELGGWTPILVFHSGYGVSELVPVVRRLHSMLASPPDDKLLAVRSKYSHKVFFEVATIPTVDLEALEKALERALK